MDRRQVLKWGMVLITLPAGWSFVGCNDNPSQAVPTDVGETGGTVDSGTTGTGDLTFVSTVVAGHSHEVTLEMTLLQNPPATGADKETTLVSGHTHVVSLSQADLQMIQSGGTVTKETSLAQSHTHTFNFTMA